jgi:dihydroneopterin aldolase
MARQALIELRDLRIEANIGTYGPADVVPDGHLLDLTLTINPHLVQIAADRMDLVFDYDPLIEQIDQLARAQHYETQEYLMTRIAQACAAYPQISGLDIGLRK